VYGRLTLQLEEDGDGELAAAAAEEEEDEGLVIGRSSRPRHRQSGERQCVTWLD